MSKRYTDIDALIAMLRNNINLPFNGGDSWAHIVQIKDKLIEHIEKNAPVADVVEVVRCKNCTFSTSLPLSDVVHGDYVLCCSGEKVPKNGFCNYGVRKDGAGSD